MKLMISSLGNTLESEPSFRFGRSPVFISYELDNDEWEAFPNPAVSDPGGAGVAAAQFIIDHGIQAAISGRFGPNAYQVLKTAGIQMWTFDTNCTTVNEVIERFENKTLRKVDV
jgi:predicted Fe-Mo cluster-binding NifX family protein